MSGCSYSVTVSGKMCSYSVVITTMIINYRKKVISSQYHKPEARASTLKPGFGAGEKKNTVKKYVFYGDGREAVH